VDEHQVAQYWDENAPVWTRLSRMGCDTSRDYVNTPAFLAMLPEVAGLRGLDIGCGEGHNTRLVARRGAGMTAIDISRRFLAAARVSEREEVLGIRHVLASGSRLPFGTGCFDFVMATMSFMDMPAHERVVAESFRVLRRGGFLQFSICHPCFATPRWRWILDNEGRRIAMECGDYFRDMDGEIESWMFGAAPEESKREFPLFHIPRFSRTLSNWVNLLIAAGFTIERFAEPVPDDEDLQQCPRVYDHRVIAYFLIIRCRKSAAAERFGCPD
jgi:ubiquinone/menaquinone biosynthesis C-methylase UbiE